MRNRAQTRGEVMPKYKHWKNEYGFVHLQLETPILSNSRHQNTCTLQYLKLRCYFEHQPNVQIGRGTHDK